MFFGPPNLAVFFSMWRFVGAPRQHHYLVYGQRHRCDTTSSFKLELPNFFQITIHRKCQYWLTDSVLYIYSKSITFPSFLVAEVSSHQWQCFLRRWMPCVHRRLFGKPLGKGRFPHGFFPCKLANGSMGNIWQLDESSFHMSNGKKETPWLFRLFFGDEIYYSVMWGL